MNKLHLMIGAVLASTWAAPSAADPIRERIYPAPTAPLALGDLRGTAEIVTARTADGLEIKGISTPARAGMPTLLVFHGNGQSADRARRWLEPLVAQGYGVLAAGYRGYSGNPGSPSGAGLARDADAFYDHARVLANGGPLWIVGHSLGGGVALALANRRPADAVITVGTFTRLRDMAPRLARSLVPNDYRNLEEVPRLTLPFVLIHGALDQVVPASMGEQLHRAAHGASRTGASFILRDKDHWPAGEALLPVFEALRQRLATGTWERGSLPESVVLWPFGQERPLGR